jgi:hypothetical protein
MRLYMPRYDALAERYGHNTVYRAFSGAVLAVQHTPWRVRIVRRVRLFLQRILHWLESDG